MTFLELLSRTVSGVKTSASAENTQPPNSLNVFPETIFGLSLRPSDNKIAVGTFVKASNDNYITIDQSKYHHRLPPSKVAWSPSDANVFASTSSSLRIWKTCSSKPEIKLHSNAKGLPTGGPSPITSMDWNPSNPAKLATSQVDTTVVIWDIERGKMDTQLIAHDRPVFDVGFCGKYNPSIFASVSEDGSLRIFDTRDLDHSTIAYEDSNPLIRLAWNQGNANLVACTVCDSSEILIFDMRKAGQISTRLLSGSNGAVNAIAWNPKNSACIAAGLANGACVSVKTSGEAKERQFDCGVVNVQWTSDGKSIAAVHDNNVSLINVDELN